MLYIYISSVNTSDQVKWWRAGGQSPQGQLAGRRWVLTRNRSLITCLCSSTLGGRKGGRAQRIVLGSDGHSISSATASAAEVWGWLETNDYVILSGNFHKNSITYRNSSNLHKGWSLVQLSLQQYAYLLWFSDCLLNNIQTISPFGMLTLYVSRQHCCNKN